MIDSTGAENVSAASSGSRIVRSARSTSRAAARAGIRPPSSPPAQGASWRATSGPARPASGRLLGHHEASPW
jgi:hypothetical protein